MTTEEKPTPRKRGRPAHIPSTKTRQKVELRAAMGWTEDQCAKDLGITTMTFRKYYREEFKFGKRRKQGEAIDLLWASARGGNVSAQKAVNALFVEARGEVGKARAKIEAPEPGTEPPVPVRSPKLGKKVARQMEAENAGLGTDWDTDLIPGDSKPN